MTEDIDIGPATLVTRSYALKKNRGFRWYATRVGVPVVAAAGLAVGLVAGGDEQPTNTEQPLPEPPLPGAK